MPSETTTCPGCGVILPKKDLPPCDRFNASAECWELYGKLAFFTLALQDDAFEHQTIVDAYEAQHPGPPAKPIALVFGLIGLYLALERGYTGREVQKAHQILGSKSKEWPLFTRPEKLGSITIDAVLKVADAEKRDAIRAWAASVWKAWEKDHQRVTELVKKYLDVSSSS